MAADSFANRLLAHGRCYHPAFLERLGDERFPLFAAANQARSKTLDDPYRSCRFLVVADDEIVYEQSKGARKALLGGDPSGCQHLERLRQILEAQQDWSIAALEATVTRYADEHAGGKMGKVAQPLRVAVSGGTVSPAIFDTLGLVGRDATLKRIDRCLKENEKGIKA